MIIDHHTKFVRAQVTFISVFNPTSTSKQWPLAQWLPDSLITHINLARRVKFCSEKCVNCQIWQVTWNVILDHGVSLAIQLSLGSQFVSTWSQSRVSILTLGKGKSRQSRNLKKLVSTIEISQFCLDTTFQSQKSWSKLRNLLRPELFGKPWLDLDLELVTFITFLDWDFSICQDFCAWSPSKSLNNVEIS